VKKLYIFCTILNLTASCISTQTLRLGSNISQRPEVYWTQVAVYLSPEQVPGRYQEIAFLEVSASAVWQREAALISALQKGAAKLGANAIIPDSINEPPAIFKLADFYIFLGLASRSKAQAIAIYLQPEGRE
jgi:hypothetical protein